MLEKNYLSSAQISHFHQIKLRQISAYTGLTGNRILEDAITQIHASIIPLIAQTAITGDLIDYTLSVTPFIKAEMVSGTFSCSMGASDFETERIRDIDIKAKFAVLDAKKEELKQSFKENKVDA